VNLDDLDDPAEREAEFERRGVIWRAKLRTLSIRRANKCSSRAALILTVIARALRKEGAK
jgi:hypothetical protein